MTRPWTHWATSSDLHALRLPAHDAGTGLAGRALGVASRGGAFVFDPFDAYAAGVVSNPNMIVAGSIGAGKSTIVKMLLDRALSDRIYPQDSGEQHFVLDELWQRLASPRPRRILRALLEQVSDHLATERPSTRRSLALTLHRFVHGDLAGLFDGEGDPLEFNGALTVVDLSAQWSASTLSVAALSAVAAARQVVSTGADQGYLVLDEAWALLSDPHALRWLQGSWKLARSKGVSHVLVLHRWSDVAAAGDVGTAHRERACGLLRECETSWLFRQPPDEAREMAIALALHPREERYLSGLAKGTVLVRYGVNRSVVRVTPDARDGLFIDTDAAMRPARR